MAAAAPWGARRGAFAREAPSCTWWRGGASRSRLSPRTFGPPAALSSSARAMRRIATRWRPISIRLKPERPVKIAFSAIDWGDSQGQDLVDHDFETFMRPIHNGLRSWFNIGTTYARHMGRNGGGVILGYTANAAREAYGQMGGFGVACAAVEHFLRHLAVENGPKGVRCCWVRSPGSPDTPGVREVWTIHARERGLTFDQFHAEIAKDTPCGASRRCANAPTQPCCWRATWLRA